MTFKFKTTAFMH